MEVCTSKKKLSDIRGRKPHSSMWRGIPHDRKSESCHQLKGIIEGLTAYVKFSIFPVLIEDDHSFVSWGVGVL